jgi:hypothetical protein
MARFALPNLPCRGLAMLAALFFLTFQAAAHEVRPALLEIKETTEGRYDVTWKIPVFEGKIPSLFPRFADNITVAGQPAVKELPGARLETSKYIATSGSLVGTEIFIEGLSALQIDVLIQVTLADGVYYSTILRPKEPFWQVPETQSGSAVFKSYALLGGEHIFGGYDHLLFVFALVLLIRNRWMLLKAVTAFTLGHSVTLALATLGFVTVPSAPTEAVIALSIMFVASEIIRTRQGVQSLAGQSPWVIAAGFGLIHGLGFAGALTEIGLPQNAIPIALLAFNVGVEIGQIIFIAGVLAAMFVMQRVGIRLPQSGWRAAPYAIGIVAAFWTVERVVSMD